MSYLIKNETPKVGFRQRCTEIRDRAKSGFFAANILDFASIIDYSNQFLSVESATIHACF